MEPRNNGDHIAKRNLTIALLLVAIIALVWVLFYLLFGSGGASFAPESNSNKAPGNYSNSANMANATRPTRTPPIYSGNSNMSNTSPGQSPTPNTPFGMMATALRDRLIADHPEKLTSDQWGKEAWQQMTIGAFYPTVFRARDVVVEVTNTCLAPQNLKLDHDGVDQLRKNIAPTTKGSACVLAMLDAANHTEALHIP